MPRRATLLFILANRAISDKLVATVGPTRDAHARVCVSRRQETSLNYSPVYAISFAPLTKLARFARKSRTLGRGIKRLHLRPRSTTGVIYTSTRARTALSRTRSRSCAYIPGIILRMAKMQFKTRRETAVRGDRPLGTRN